MLKQPLQVFQKLLLLQLFQHLEQNQNEIIKQGTSQPI